MAKASPKLAIVLSHPIQYYSPWFRWLRTHTELNFRVFYLSDFGIKPAEDAKFKTTFAWDTDLTSGYDWEIVANVAKHPDTLTFNGLNNPDLFPRLAEMKPDAILVFGYKYRTHLRLIAWARFHGVPLIFRGDSHLLDRPSLSSLKLSALTLLYRQFSAVTYVGQANRDYFSRLGVPEERLFFAPHAVDSSVFSPRAEIDREASTLRRSLGIPESSQVILFAGKLIASKQPRELLSAFLRIDAHDTTLVIAGDGPEREALASAASHVAERVKFLLFANQSEMPARYRMADLFVLPSRGSYETWGLAVNEAMHMGRPCLVSDQVGCQRDLVSDGETGWVFPSNDPTALAQKIKEALATLRSDSARIHEAVTERIAGYSYKSAAEGLLRSVHYAVAS